MSEADIYDIANRIKHLVETLEEIEQHLRALVILFAEESVGPVRTKSLKILDEYTDK